MTPGTPLRVLLVQDSFLPAIGGAEIHVAKLGAALRDRGHFVTVVTATPGPPVWDAMPVSRFPDLNGGDRRALARLPMALPRLISLSRQHDIVHCHFSFFLASVYAVARPRHTPMVLTLHGLGTLDSSVGKELHLRFYRWLSIKSARRVIATSSEMAAVAHRFSAADRVTIIPNGVDTTLEDDRSPRRVDGRLQVLALRRLEPKNGVQYLLEAVPEMIKLLDGRVNVRIVGGGPLEAYLRRRTLELGIERHVEFFGVLPNHEALKLMDEADVVVFPSSAESTSIAALEAMARGKAVVASAVGAFPEMLGDDERGILVSLFDRTASDYDAPLVLPAPRISALAQAVARLGASSDLAARLGTRARDHVRQHNDWTVIAARVDECYRSALHASSRG